MDTDAAFREALADDALTEQIIGCAYRVSNALGCGFLEKVYENALAYEFRKAKLPFEQQKELKVRYEGVVVGDYVADLIVRERVLLEIKAARGIDMVHTAQCLNYLRATAIKLGLILNFGRPKVEIKRLIV
jgi:GxxExxY protein